MAVAMKPVLHSHGKEVPSACFNRNRLRSTSRSCSMGNSCCDGVSEAETEFVLEAHPSPPAVAQVFFAFLGSPRDLQL
eukprot:s2433_g5.t1